MQHNVVIGVCHHLIAKIIYINIKLRIIQSKIRVLSLCPNLFFLWLILNRFKILIIIYFCDCNYKSFVFLLESFFLLFELLNHCFTFFFLFRCFFPEALQERISWFFIFFYNYFGFRSGSYPIILFPFFFLLIHFTLFFLFIFFLFFNMFQPLKTTHSLLVILHCLVVIPFVEFLISLFSEFIIHKEPLSYL